MIYGLGSNQSIYRCAFAVSPLVAGECTPELIFNRIRRIYTKYFAIAKLIDQFGVPYDCNLRKGGYLDRGRAIEAINRRGGGRVIDQFGTQVAEIHPQPGGRRLAI